MLFTETDVADELRVLDGVAGIDVEDGVALEIISGPGFNSSL